MSGNRRSVRDGFGAALLELGAKNPQVVALSADLQESVRMHVFAQKYPERFFEVGVAEQNLIGISAGLAAEGYVAFAGSFAAFSPGRTFDQIRVSVCYGQRNVKIVGGHAGLTVGEDGATHQMLEDLAMLRALPNMRLLIPADFSSAHFLTNSAAEVDGPTYLRLSRLSVPDLLPEKFDPAEPVILHQGKDIALVFCGILGARTIQLAKLMETQTGVAPSVIALTQLKPWNESAWLKTLSQYKAVISIEEHQQMGGMGSALAELLSSHSPRPLEIIGVQDTFGESGEAEALLDAYGFAPQAMLERVGKFLKRHQVL
jgi:transketolase